jgi:hypothetical protein
LEGFPANLHSTNFSTITITYHPGLVQYASKWPQYPKSHSTNINKKNGRAIAQAVSRRLPTAEARIQTRVWSCGILWTKVALRQVFSENFAVSPANLHSICFSTIIFTITRG